VLTLNFLNTEYQRHTDHFADASLQAAPVNLIWNT